MDLITLEVLRNKFDVIADEMAEQQSGLTPMDLGRYYMRRMAMRVETEHFQELCRTVAYAIDPAHTAYSFAVHYGVTDLPTPAEIWRAGTLPE